MTPYRLCILLALLATACTPPRLIKAAQAGDVAEVERQLARGERADVRGAEGATPLFWAAAKGNRDLALTLLAHGADVNARADRGHTPLHAAAYWGRDGLVELLLEKGADVSARTSLDATPLHRALERLSNEEILRRRIAVAPELLDAMTRTAALLLDHGADPNASMSSGETPLILATATGHASAVELLLARGAALDGRGRDDVTPLYVAVVAGRVGLVELLLARGAQVDARTKSRYTPLSYAAREGHLAAAKLLVARGADPSAVDAEGRTPLGWALSMWALGSPAGETLLRASGVSAADRGDARKRLADVEGRWREVALHLVEHGADVRAHGAKDPSPLHLAAVVGDAGVVAALLDRGAPVDEVTAGETALHAALAERHAEVAALLLDRKADVRAVNLGRRTPLHFAAAFLDDAALVERIIAQGADVNAKDGDRHTPLHYANAAGNARVAAALRAHGGT
jgi:ankyrin repeat protein